ncbi:hypothetical protein TNCV_671551 [Trichonephila clavipes]|nr:hypothetical protein TNCV_671551 [Trichonephila clavipes]
MLQDYDTSFSRLYFPQPPFSRHPLSLPRSRPFLLCPCQILLFISSLVRPVARCRQRFLTVSNHGRHVMSSIAVPPKTRRVGQRCTLNMSRAETSSRWCGVVVRRGGASSGVVHVT